MRKSALAFVVAGGVVALLMSFVVSRSASSEPDGLERVAADHELDSGQDAHAFADSPLADYSTRGVEDPGTSTGVAGVVGTCVVFMVAGGLAWLLARSGRVDREAADPRSERCER